MTEYVASDHSMQMMQYPDGTIVEGSVSTAMNPMLLSPSNSNHLQNTILHHHSEQPTMGIMPMNSGLQGNHHPQHQHTHGTGNNALNTEDGNTERCRFCGQELPMDAFTVVAHFNNHWRQFSLEAVNQCVYDPHTMMDRMSNNHQNFIHNNVVDHSSNQVNGSNEMINHNSNMMHSLANHNQPNSFPYSYSPQTEPSNLSIPGNHLKCHGNESPNINVNSNGSSCMENEPSNAAIHTISNNQDDSSNNLNMCAKGQAHSNMVCNSVLGMSSPHHNMESPGLQVAGNRCSPLNLTGRPKVVPSPIVQTVNLDGGNGTNLGGIEHQCSMQSGSTHITQPDMQHTSVNFTPHVHNGENNIGHTGPIFPSNNYTFSNNYFNTQYPYNMPQQIPTEPSGCQLQGTLTHNLENVGLSIPVLSPNVPSIHQTNSEQCLESEKSAGNLSHNVDPIQNDTNVIVTNSPLTTPCSAMLSSCNQNDTHDSVNSSSNQDICVNPIVQSVDHTHEENPQAIPKNSSQFNCHLCNETFTDKILHHNHIVNHYANDKKTLALTSPVSCSPEVQQDLIPPTSTTNNSNQNVDVIPVLKNVTTPSSLSETTSKPYKCSICNQEFSVKEELRDHFQDHEAAKPFHCDICGLGVSNNRALKRHKLTHTGYKPYKCETCGKCFLQRHDLNRHMNIHERPKYFTCDQCKRIFTAVSSYKSHKCKGAKEVKPFTCHICGDGCTNRLAWSYHMWKHTKNPMFVPFQDNVMSESTA